MIGLYHPQMTCTCHRRFFNVTFPFVCSCGQRWTHAAEHEIANEIDPAFTLVRSEKHAIGRGFHRSGWPHVFSELTKYHGAGRVLLDDFIEQTFSYNDDPHPHTRPWVGIFHHPPGMPVFSRKEERPENIVNTPAFAESLPYLRFGFCLSHHAAKHWSDLTNRAFSVLKHPTATNVKRWKGGKRRLVQIGWYLRNTQAIYQCRAKGWQRVRFLDKRKHIAAYDERVKRHWNGIRKSYSPRKVSEKAFVTHAAYDEFLSTSVILTELFSASANNVVIECIARATPLIINRHPAAIEYLGTDYPLFFNTIDEVDILLSDAERIQSAHDYMLGLDKTWMDAAQFAERIARAVRC